VQDGAYSIIAPPWGTTSQLIPLQEIKQIEALRVGTSTVHRWLEDVSQAEHVTTPAVITDITGRQPPAHQERRLKASTAATTHATDTARPVPKVSQTPDALPASTDSAARFDEQATEVSTDPSQAPAKPPVPQAADDLGKRVRVQIERLYRRLQQQRAQGSLRALANTWPTTQKEHYRRRCTDLMGALEALRDVLSAAEIEDEDGDGVAAMLSAHDAFTDLEAPTL
jgi:predicted transcriptional regulator